MDGDEEDGYDEVIYPVDFRQVGHITDDEMHRILVKPLQAGVRLTAIFDSCHSGTALDLPYIYSTHGVLKEPNLAKEAGQGLLGVLSSYSQGDIGGMIKKGMGLFTKATRGEEAHNRTLRTKTSAADVIMLSGSKDDQTSYVHSPPFFFVSWIFLGFLQILSALYAGGKVGPGGNISRSIAVRTCIFPRWQGSTRFSRRNKETAPKGSVRLATLDGYWI